MENMEFNILAYTTKSSKWSPSIEVSPLKLYVQLSSPLHMPHDLRISSPLIWSPEEYLVWSIKDEASRMQFSTASSYLLPPNVKLFLPQHPIL